MKHDFNPRQGPGAMLSTVVALFFHLEARGPRATSRRFRFGAQSERYFAVTSNDLLPQCYR